MKGIITPNILKGEINIPPSKSVAHRAIICASLANGKSTITNIQLSKDIFATIEGMHALGADFVIKDNALEVYGLMSKNLNDLNDIYINCKESGSTLRFLTMLVPALTNKQAQFVGEGKLGSRPMDAFFKIFKEQNINYKDESKDLLDLKIQGVLHGGLFELEGNVSSQFITGLLFACPLLKEDSIIRLKNKLQSIGYIDLTLDALKTFGIVVENRNYQEFIVKGNQEYKSCDYKVEGDYSQAAFYVVANALGNDVKLKGLNKNSLQGDKVIYDYVKQLKDAKEDDIIVLDGENCPDIIPVLSVYAALRKGKTKIVNIERLKIKECDRLNAVYTELKKLGANIKKGENYLEFTGVEKFKGGRLSTFNDHRMAMTLAIASTKSTKKLYLDNIQCVSKSYPNFWQDFESIGGLMKVED